MNVAPRTRIGAIGAISRVAVAMLAMGASLAFATWPAGLLGVEAIPCQPFASRVAGGGAVALFVVGVILLLCRLWGRLPLAFIGLSGTLADALGPVLVMRSADLAWLSKQPGMERWPSTPSPVDSRVNACEPS